MISKIPKNIQPFNEGLKRVARDTFKDGTMEIASSTVSGQRLPRTQSCKFQERWDKPSHRITISKLIKPCDYVHIPQTQPTDTCLEFYMVVVKI